MLVVAAFEPELKPLRDRLTNVEFGTVGIGVVRAALGMQALLGERRPERVLFVGTCGAFPGRGISELDVVSSRAVGLVDPAVVAGDAAVISQRELPMVPLADLKGVRVANTVGVTVSDPLAQQYADAGFDIEHLEIYAVALACTLAGIPLHAMFGVANMVGSVGRASWKKNHEAASEHVAERCLSLLKIPEDGGRRGPGEP